MSKLPHRERRAGQLRILGVIAVLFDEPLSELVRRLDIANLSGAPCLHNQKVLGFVYLVTCHLPGDRREVDIVACGNVHPQQREMHLR